MDHFNCSMYAMLGEMSKLNNLICIIIKIFQWKTIYFCFGSYMWLGYIQYNFQWISFRCISRMPYGILKTISLNRIKSEEKKNISLSKIHPFSKSMFLEWTLGYFYIVHPKSNCFIKSKRNKRKQYTTLNWKDFSVEHRSNDLWKSIHRNITPVNWLLIFSHIFILL